MPRIVVVIPCFNEAQRLDRDRFRAFGRDGGSVELLFVNDGSTDATETTLRSLCAEAPGRLSLLSLAKNQGKAEAVRQGLLRAIESRPDFVGYWDADLATPLEAIGELAAIFEEKPHVEMVFGSRVKLLGRSIERRVVRHYAGRVFATAVSVLLRLPIYDTQCGAKLFRRTTDLERLFAKPFVTRWIFDVEIIARLIHARRGTARPQAKDAIYEYPLRAWRDVHGSKLRPADFVKAFFELAAIYRRYLAGGSGGPPSSGSES